MKKTLLVILVIAAVVFSAFADGFHYGLESDIEYSFNMSEENVGDNEATFKFKPYVYNDNFTVRLLAEWKPNLDGAHGFDYLFDFDTTDFYTITASSLKYVDEISVRSDIVNFVIGKGSRVFEIKYDGENEGLYKNRAQLNLNVGPVKVDVFSTDFVKFGYLYPDEYNSVQYADVKVNLGLIEVEAAVMRQGYYIELTSLAALGKNRIIPKIGVKLQFGLANVGFYFTTDTTFDENDDAIIKLLDRWVLEALAEFKVGTFDLTGKFYLDNKLQGYSNMFFQETLFGFRADADLKLGEFLSLNISGDLPLKLDGALRVVRYHGKSLESLSAKFEVGTWWKVGAEIAVRGLISQLENGDDFMTILKRAEPTITAGIYTTPLDVTASAKLTTKYSTDFVPEVTIAATIRADNFLSNVK